jgi:hypothetical protein
VVSGPLRACLDRQETLADRKAYLDNQRVADMNAAASSLNGDSADMMAYCNFRYAR